jgi:hypothetical protein
MDNHSNEALVKLVEAIAADPLYERLGRRVHFAINRAKVDLESGTRSLDGPIDKARQSLHEAIDTLIDAIEITEAQIIGEIHGVQKN